MMLNGRRLAIFAFLLWEAWWAYVFIMAFVPDYKMDSVFALVMGVFLPLLIAAFVGLMVFMRRLTRPKSKRCR